MYSHFPSSWRLMLFGVMLGALHLSCSYATPPIQSANPVPQPVLENAAYTRGVLRVCSDPNNLPFSNQKLEGFENKIADLLAREMNLKLEYTWWAQRRGFVRNTLKAGACDLIIGIPSSSELALTTAPYYRSTYVFVTRNDNRLNINSFDDSSLHNVRIGVQMIGDDFANTPPAHALSNRKIISNVRPFTVYGDYSEANPPARIISAVANGEIDVAIVWGPLAGFFTKTRHLPLKIVPVSPQIDLPYLPFVFDVSMGVRRSDTRFRDQLETILEQRHLEIEQILSDYAVPQINLRAKQIGL
ncbi:MAG: quinoprotein dehydrogenase-associated putative ABC transporter substrate-binding protein [Acidobacteria bacterium]|nr:MAG: quinoprotein dehydrogenase-associated putative ABC transporter substrate-binding protein [Acidobacteriota bacterium]